MYKDYDFMLAVFHGTEKRPWLFFISMKNSHIKIWIKNRRLASLEYPLRSFAETGHNLPEGKAGEPPAEGSY